MDSNQAGAPRRPHFLALLATTLALTAAADYLLYGHRVGLGLALFLPLVWLGLAANRDRWRPTGKNLLLAVLLVGCAGATAIAPSGANLLVLFALTCYASGHWLAEKLSPYWARALKGFTALLWFPSAIQNAAGGIERMFVSADPTQAKRRAGGVWRLLCIVIPAALVTLPFIFLLGGGNAVVGQFIDDTIARFSEMLSGFELPTEARVVFWLFVSAVLFSLLGNRAPVPFGAPFSSSRGQAAPSDPAVAIWRTRLLLLAVNLLFFAANAADIVYLWSGSPDLPEGVTYSEFVHEGVHNLVAGVVLAALVLLFLFNQSPAVTRARAQRSLAIVWIGQNLLLVAGVVLRLKLYVDAYGMSLQRVHLVLFLALVAAGFALLAARIIRERTLAWLVGSNLLAVFALFYTVQFLDLKGFVANYNVRAASGGESAVVLDMDYLYQLAPESWPALREVADSPEVFGDDSETAAVWLAEAAWREGAELQAEDWRSWSGRLARLRRDGLRGIEPAPTLGGLVADGRESWRR